MVAVADQRRHAVVAQAAGVDGCRHEVGTEGVHLQQRREVRGVAEVVLVFALGERRRCLRLAGDDLRLRTALEVLADEREADPGEVRATTGAGEQVVGRTLAEQRELLQGLLADHRLVQRDVVQHGAEGVAGVLVLRRSLDGLADGHAQRAGGVGELLAQHPSGFGQLGGAGDDARTEGLHQHMAVGLALVGAPHLPDVAGEAEDLAGERQRGTPLAGAGLRGQPGASGDLVEVGLRHGRVRLVATDRRSALVLVVDARGRAQRLLQAVCPVEGGRPPEAVDVMHFCGDLDPALRGRLLLDQAHREQRRQVFRHQGLVRARVQVRRRGSGQVGHEVVPVGRHLRLVENYFGLLGIAHGQHFRAKPAAQGHGPAPIPSVVGTFSSASPKWDESAPRGRHEVASAVPGATRCRFVPEHRPGSG